MPCSGGAPLWLNPLIVLGLRLLQIGELHRKLRVCLSQLLQYQRTHGTLPGMVSLQLLGDEAAAAAAAAAQGQAGGAAAAAAAALGDGKRAAAGGKAAVRARTLIRQRKWTQRVC